MNPEQPTQTPLPSTQTDQHSQMSPNGHNPIKSIKIDFHTADGMTPKPLGGDPAGGDLGKSSTPHDPQTKLSPLEEVLFKHWATANGVQDHDAPDNAYDYRGVYRQTGGQVHSPGQISGAADQYNRIMNNPIRPMASHQQPLLAPGIHNYTADKEQALGHSLHDENSQNDATMNAFQGDPIRQLINILQRQNSGQ
jgi:hypothetical protein